MEKEVFEQYKQPFELQLALKTEIKFWKLVVERGRFV